MARSKTTKEATAIATKREPNQEVASYGDDMNPFERLGKLAGRSIVGRLLKFSKGDYLAGQEEEEVPEGTELVLNTDNTLIGWVKWVNQYPEDQLLGSVAEGFSPPPRTTLGDTDKEQWDVDNQGNRRDPWQYTVQMLMKPLRVTGQDDENLFTFTTSSEGGKGAAFKVFGDFGKEMRMHPEEYPVIRLGVNEYKHKVKEFGRIKVPVFTHVGWESKAVFQGKAAAQRGKQQR